MSRLVSFRPTCLQLAVAIVRNTVNVAKAEAKTRAHGQADAITLSRNVLSRKLAHLLEITFCAMTHPSPSPGHSHAPKYQQHGVSSAFHVRASAALRRRIDVSPDRPPTARPMGSSRFVMRDGESGEKSRKKDLVGPPCTPL